jgi:hypothetical protein
MEENMRKIALLAMIGIIAIAFQVSAKQIALANASAKMVNNVNSKLNPQALPSDAKIFGDGHNLTETHDWLFHHGTLAYFWRMANWATAVRYTMPSPTLSPCSLLTVSVCTYRLAVSSNVAELCSLFVFRDSILDGYHKPGDRIFADTVRVPAQTSVPGLVWHDFNVSYANITFPAGANFWSGFQIIHDPLDSLFVVSDAGQTDTTWDAYDVTIPAGPVGDWYIDAYYGWAQEAEVGYTPAILDDVGVVDVDMPGYVIVGSPASILITIHNYGASTQTSVPVAYDPGDGSGVVTGTWTGSIANGAEDTFRFTTPWTPATSGIYDFMTWTDLTGDEVPTNDTLVVDDYYVVDPCPPFHVPPYAKDFNEGWGPYGDNPPHCGWTIVDYGNEPTPEWNSNDWFHAAPSWANYRSCAVISGWAELEDVNDWLISPQFDCSAPGQYTLGYWSDYVGWAGAEPDTGIVKLSTDDGFTWTELYRYTGGTSGPIDTGYKSIDITTLVEGQSNVKIAFQYLAYDANVWAIDDFTLDYLPEEYALIINVVGAGHVDTVPSLLTYPYGTEVTLTAVPDAGNLFVGWSDSLTGSTTPTSIIMNSEKVVTATFGSAGTPGWAQMESVVTPHIDDKTIKDGGALVGVPGSGKDPAKLYAFLGTKTSRVRIYTIGSGWSDGDSMIFGHKYKPATGEINPDKFNKKFPGKGAAMCYDGAGKIYATKGNGTNEFFVYDMTSDAGWTAKAFVPTLKGLKGGTSIRFYDGKVYLLAGGQKKDAATIFYSYDPNADTTGGTPWAELGKPPLGPDIKVWKDGSTIIELGGTIYALHGGAKSNLFYAYDWGTNTWLDKEPLPIEDSSYHKYKKKILVKDGAATATDGSIIYATKGGGAEVFWKYTPTSDVGWERLDRMPIEKIDKKHAPKTGAAMAFVDGQIWLLTGNKQPDFWCYTPGAKGVARVNPSTITSVATERTSTTHNFNFEVSPNPFTKLSTIRYTVPISGKVSIKLYNASGRLVETFNDGYLSAGNYTTTLSNIASGVYFVKYESNTNNSELKLIVQ